MSKSTQEKAVHFLVALKDVYCEEDNRELAVFSKLDLGEDVTDDFAAMLLAMKYMAEKLIGYDGDLIDFTHVLNKLAVQHIMEGMGSSNES